MNCGLSACVLNEARRPFWMSVMRLCVRSPSSSLNASSFDAFRFFLDSAKTHSLRSLLHLKHGGPRGKSTPEVMNGKSVCIAVIDQDNSLPISHLTFLSRHGWHAWYPRRCRDGSVLWGSGEEDMACPWLPTEEPGSCWRLLLWPFRAMVEVVRLKCAGLRRRRRLG